MEIAFFKNVTPLFEINNERRSHDTIEQQNRHTHTKRERKKKMEQAPTEWKQFYDKL